MGRRVRSERDTDVKMGLEMRNEAAALFLGICKIRGRVQREVVSDAVEFYITKFVSANDTKLLMETDEYRNVKKHSQNWKRHMPKKKEQEKTPEAGFQHGYADADTPVVE